jgi:hypothetical protein
MGTVLFSEKWGRFYFHEEIGSDSPGETLGVLKEKELGQFGES